MGRAPRQVGAGGSYHLMARGSGKRRVFFDDDHYAEFVRRTGETARRHGWTLHAFCLMPNHVHLAVTTGEPTMPAGMRDLLGGFARWSNRVRVSAGHLFSAHYRDVPIDSDRQLLAVTRYICRNPVRAGLVESPADWPWSSYAATIAPAAGGRTIIDAATVLGLLDPDPRRARTAFRRLVEDEAPTPGVHPALMDPTGDSARALGIREILREFGEREGVTVSLRLGFRQRDIAAELGISPSALSHRIDRS